MATTSSELAEIKRKVEQAKVDYERAVGRMDAIIAQMKAEGFNSIQELEDEIKRLNEERDRLRTQLTAEIDKFKDVYAELLK